MKIANKRALTLSISIMLIASLLLINLNSTSAPSSSNPIYLHGPALTPIHMHYTGGLLDLSNPWQTNWHELYPAYCNQHLFTSWEDNGNGYLDAGEQIDMLNLTSHETNWYFVDRITITLILSGPYPEPWHEPGEPSMAIELKWPYYDPQIIYYPNFIKTLWHEVWPIYSPVYNLTSFYDDLTLPQGGDGMLSFTDSIDLALIKPLSAPPTFWHIEDVATDLILNKKISDPVGTNWNELYPQFGNSYTIDGWKDNITNPYTMLLSPCDTVNMTLQPEGPTKTYHVENMNVTIKVQSWFEPSYFMYLDAITSFEYMYYPKIMPDEFYWHEIWPDFSNIYWMSSWVDNCNGVLSYCDNITLFNPESLDFIFCHVEEVAVDMVVKEVVPPPPMYWKPGYPNYAPSGMPDFDQKQDAWNPTGKFTWCAPTAVANSLWWMDSRFHPSNLLTVYQGAISEHDPSNVIPFITHLAYLMDTDGIRTVPGGGAAHTGTWRWDMETGIAQYLSWTGVNPQGDCDGNGIVDIRDKWIVGNATGKTPGMAGWDIRADIYPVTTGWPVVNLADNIVNAFDLALVTANMGKSGTFYENTMYTPDFYTVEGEVEKCEDVVLGLGFWKWTGTTWERFDYPYEEGSGHAVTVAGINSTSLKIAISDPDNDAFHDGLIPQGRVPVAHPQYPHNSTIHNNASLVSQDIYNVIFTQGCPGGSWALQGYVGAPPGYLAIVEAAVITSPYIIDVAVTDVRPWPPGRTVAYQGLNFKINVTVQNQGDLTETFNVTLYANTTIVLGYYKLTVPAGFTNQTIFTWSVPSNFTKGNYTLSATATLSGDMDLSDNTFTDGVINVNMAVDLNGDKKCNILDLVKLAGQFGQNAPPADPKYDLDCNGKINILDLVICARFFGNTDP